MTAILLDITFVVGVFALLFYIGLYFMQDKILFCQRPLQTAIQDWIIQTYPDSEIEITTDSGIQLHGWLLKKSHQEKTPLVIYFGGNSEEVSGMAYHFERFADCSLLLINYRGYGLSEGKPSERNLFNDAETIFDNIIQRQDIDPNGIVAMGRSLGTGVAVHLAARRPLKGVILVSPYDSIFRVAQRHFPFVPIKLLLKNPFNVIKLAPSITTPMLALVAQQDTLIPAIHSHRLANKWGGATKIKQIENANHDNIPDNEIYWNAIRDFLGRLLK
ncbi:alpha/beta fold hydrolase [Candidatus Parabeggiatoa sp. HSG14]|uniref:alpha/beta hydrolase n=1 Tax=Candidatus Parabeggiatoa sp. HSG14 TaxID=3055593 RepID=UPI0025A7AE48|nr:alpha/beta hydrolase [Thiotrichales bacterium HSG14]